MKTARRLMLALLFCITLLVGVHSTAFAETVDSGSWGDFNWTLNDTGALTISGTGSAGGFSSNSTNAYLAYRDSTALNASQLASGTWGGNLNWTLDYFGTLTISGTGEMTDFERNSTDAWRQYKNNIRKVVIKTGVESIGKFAFWQCSNLTDITIPEGVTKIRGASFTSCSNLRSVTFPQSLTVFGSDVFMNCHSLKSVNIPANVKIMDGFPFANCNSLIGIYVDPENQTFCDVDGILFTKDKTIIWQFPAGKAGTYLIPDTVKIIQWGAFSGCARLTDVTIPEGVSSINPQTFSDCSALKSVTIPYSVKSIGDYAFRGCSNLTDIYYFGTRSQWNKVIIGNDNECLGNAIIHFCAPDMVLPAELTSISSEAFAGGGFTYIKLPDKCITIGPRAFADCPNLMYVEIPNEKVEIASSAFAGVNGLTILGVSGSTAEAYAAAHGYTFIAVS